MKDIKLNKPRAKTYIVFESDKNDDWLVWIRHYENSGKLKRSSLIIQKDIDGFLSMYLNKGWIISDVEEKKTIKTPPKKKPNKTK